MKKIYIKVYLLDYGFYINIINLNDILFLFYIINKKRFYFIKNTIIIYIFSKLFMN